MPGFLDLRKYAKTPEEKAALDRYYASRTLGGKPVGPTSASPPPPTQGATPPPAPAAASSAPPAAAAAAAGSAARGPGGISWAWLGVGVAGILGVVLLLRKR